MYTVYRYLTDVRYRTPTNLRWAMQNEAKRLNMTFEQIDDMIRRYDDRADKVCALVPEMREERPEYRGDSCSVKRVLEFDHPMTIEDVRIYVDYWWPATYCTHDYDCCGHWYSNWAKIEAFSPTTFVVTQTSYQNV